MSSSPAPEGYELAAEGGALPAEGGALPAEGGALPAEGGALPPAEWGEPPPGKPQRRTVLLRLDPAVHAALVRWAQDELRSANAQVELLVRRALAQAGRLPQDVGPLPRRGRPPAS